MPGKSKGLAKKVKKNPRVKVRLAEASEVTEIHRCQAAAYPTLPPDGLCDERLLAMQLAVFPEGQLVAVCDGVIVGYAMSLIVSLDDASPWYSYSEITGVGTFSTHTSSGDTLYGADIAVHPDFRGRGVAGLLYKGRKRILKRFNLRRMVAGGRIPGFREHAGRMSAEDYVAKVVAGELKDMALTAHIKAGYRVMGVHLGYLGDAASLDYATYIEYQNPSFNAARRRIAAAPIRRPARKVRVCAVQYGMRRVRTWEEVEHQLDFFIATANEYHCHFVLFPELLTAQLFSMFPYEMPLEEVIRGVEQYHERFMALFRDRARRHGLFIIGGTHLVHTSEGLRNIAYLFTPGGEIHEQEKLHITPTEREYYGVEPGAGLKVFDTGLARIAIVICYDIEFPELTRLLTLAGAEIVFVPFATDERKAYFRVRYCAQARAVENMIYTVLSGSTGNLPQVRNFLLNYGRAAILTPADFAFPTDGVAAEAGADGETVVISDLDLDSLDQQREMGSVRLLRDRRKDLYSLQAREPVQVIRTS